MDMANNYNEITFTFVSIYRYSINTLTYFSKFIIHGLLCPTITLKNHDSIRNAMYTNNFSKFAENFICQ